MKTINDFSKEQYDIIHIETADELKRKGSMGDLLLLQNNVYKIKKIVKNIKSDEYCALLINIDNSEDKKDESLNNLVKNSPYLIKEKNEINESYQKYKDWYIDNNKSVIFLESLTSYLNMIKTELKYFKNNYPESLNEFIILEDGRITYFNRIAGFYNPLSNELDVNVRHQIQHQNPEEYLSSGWVRFYICDVRDRACFISAVEKDTAIQGYNYLKNKYKELGIGYFVIDWINPTTDSLIVDDKGKPKNYDDLYEQVKKSLYGNKIMINEAIKEKILYIIRGIPGSGKSTLANKLTSNVVEADQFMYEYGEYKWKPEKLHMAHKKCQETVEQYMQEGRDKIAVANTFIKLKEIKPYIDLAKQYDYKIVVKECDGGFQNVHGVPEETLEKMKSKFQPYIEESVEEITFEPSNESFVIGGKDFTEEGCNVYSIKLNGEKIGMLAISKMNNGINLEGLSFDESYRNRGYGHKVVKMLKDKYKKIYVRSIPDAKGFWDKQGHKSYWNDDSGTYDGMLNESEEKIIAYHGSQHKKFNFRDDKVLYLTTNKEKAISYAKREWDEGLIEGEVPVVYTFEVSVKNPYECHTENEFQSEFCDVNMNEEGGKEELIEKGYDSIKYQDLIGVFSSSQFKLVDTEVLPPSLDYYYPKDTKYGDEDINDYYYDGEEMNESKQLTESILYDDLAYNDWNEKYEQLTVIANPSIDWLRNQLNSDDCYGFRFLHNTERNKLYVWDCKQPWMHQQVFDMVDMDWGKPGTNVIGIFEPDCVAVWEALADDGEASSSIKLAKKLDGELFKQLYPNGYQMTTCC